MCAGCSGLAAVRRFVECMAAAGKEPVRRRREVPGFLGNRLQHALQREALYLVEQGIASPEDVDRVVKYAFGLRCALMGPLERADLGVMKFEEYSKRMYLSEYYPGVTPAQVAENTGFALDVTRAAESVPPSPEELRILRQDVDPQRLILGPMPA